MRPERFERSTHALKGRCYLHLSYGPIGVQDRTWTGNESYLTRSLALRVSQFHHLDIIKELGSLDQIWTDDNLRIRQVLLPAELRDYNKPNNSCDQSDLNWHPENSRLAPETSVST